MSRKKSADKYEVGYAKPPKNTQFQKDISGNPTGRPKKPVNFDQQFLREARLPVFINENGRQMRVTKHDIAISQLIHKTMKGDPNATKVYFSYYRQASEKDALLASEQKSGTEARNDAKQFTEAELERIILASMKNKK